MKNFFIFVHIQRTGGTTFLHVLEQNFGKRMMSWGNFDTTLENKDIDCIYGHIMVHSENFRWIHEWCKKHDRNPIVLSFVRNPFYRAISWYNYCTRNEENPPPYDGWQGNEQTNVQAYALSGGPAVQLYIGTTDMFDESLRYFQYLFPKEFKDISYNKRYNETPQVKKVTFFVTNKHIPAASPENEVDWALWRCTKKYIQDSVEGLEVNDGK
jgi:hypothetical protein